MREFVSLSDADLIGKCLEGDADAWEALVRRYQRLIASITLKFRLESEDSSDIFQSVCVALLQQLPNLKKDAKFSSWIITVSVRECWRLRERSRKKSTVSVEDPEQASHTQLWTPPLAEDALLTLERQHVMRRSVESLPEPCRRLLDLLFYQAEPATYAEISRQVGLPIASIGPTRGRCLTKLKVALEKNGFLFGSCISPFARDHS